ncbi:MAG: SBBP repeat-containing protein [Chloroflexi bacterium]|nr:SBBP repeat-containing protein [Chloroflexota bacterium]
MLSLRTRIVVCSLLLAATLVLPTARTLAQELAWVRQFGASTGNSIAFGNDIAVDNLGHAYVVGGDGEGGTLLRKVSAAGDPVWNRDFRFNAQDSNWRSDGFGATVSPGQHLYIAGTAWTMSPGPSGTDSQCRAVWHASRCRTTSVSA